MLLSTALAVLLGGGLEGVVPKLVPNSKVTYTVVAGDTCASIAYSIRLKQGAAVYIRRGPSGPLCGADDVLKAGEVLTLQSNALQGVIGSYLNGMQPPPLASISRCYNQLVVAGAADGGGGAYAPTGAIDKLLPEIRPWKMAYPGTRQVLLQVNNVVPAKGQSDTDWATAAYTSLVKIANEHNCDGFFISQAADPGQAISATGALQALVTMIKLSPWTFVGYVGGSTTPAMAAANVGVDSMGFTGSFKDGRFVNYPAPNFGPDTTSYYCYTRSSAYEGNNIGLEVWSFPPYGVTIDSIETEYYGKSCSSGRRLLGRELGGERALGSAACPNGGKCCATDFVAGKWGLTGSVC
jgi:hypothetical protein